MCPFFTTEDKSKLFYEIHGKNDSKPIILLHGWGVGSAFFSEQIPSLVKEGYKVIAMDARSHGKSDKNSLYYAQYKDQLLDLMYMDFKSLLYHLKLKDKFTLIGHSAGGGISLVFGTRTELKDRIASIILINSAYTISENPSILLLWQLVPIFVNVIYNPLLRTGYKLILQSNGTITALSLALNQSREKIKRWLDDILNIPKEAIINEYRNFKRYNLKEHLKDVLCPTLIIGAELDMITPAFMSIEMSKLIPNSELFIVKNAGHGSMIEQAPTVNQRIITFLRKNYPL